MPLPVLNEGKARYVDPVSGNDGNHGKNWANAKGTLQAAVNASASGDDIFCAPGDYDENVTIPRSKSNLTIWGVGGRGSVSVVAQGTNATAITVHGRDCSLKNIGGAGTGTGAGLRVTGRRFHCDSACKFENQDVTTGYAAIIGPGLVAAIDADTQDKGDFGRYEAEFCYADKGILLQGSDYGACGQNSFVGSRSHNCVSAHFEEAHLAGGANTLHYRDLLIDGHTFEHGSDDAGAVVATVKFLSLDDDNANLGQVQNCAFPVALNSGKSLVSTGLTWVANKHPAGLSTGQPS